MIIFSLLISGSSFSQITHDKVLSYYEQSDRDYYDSKRYKILKWASSGDAYKQMALRRSFGAVNTMIQSTKDEMRIYWINEQKLAIDSLINSSRVLRKTINTNQYNDHFNGWVSLNKNKYFQKEIPLYESYSFFYITQFLFYLHNENWVQESEINKKWWNNTLDFIEENLWNKWYLRSKIYEENPYRIFLRSRTHMGSHWAGIAMYLREISKDDSIKAQAQIVKSQYDKLLKRNLKINKNSYIWNATYDDTKNTYAFQTKKSIIQDVSHGNHVISYIIAAYELGDENWTEEDLNRLANTIKQFIYDKNSNSFHDNVDGSDGIGLNNPGWGNKVGESWVKLAKYDVDVKNIFLNFLDSEKFSEYSQSLEYYANLYYSEQ